MFEAWVFIFFAPYDRSLLVVANLNKIGKNVVWIFPSTNCKHAFSPLHFQIKFSNIWRNYFILNCIQVRICTLIIYFNYKNKLLDHIGSDNYWIIFFPLTLYYIIIIVWHGHYLIQARMWVYWCTQFRLLLFN